MTQEKIKKLAVDEDNLKLSEILKIKKAVSICSDESLIETLRKNKDATEIENIQKACKLGDKTFQYILAEIKLGITEKKIAQKIEIFILKNDAQISFKPIIAFSKNSSSPHHVASDRKLQKNEIVLLDFGVKINNYCSDMTRTVFFGKASNEQKKIYRVVLESQTKAIQQLNNLTIKKHINKLMLPILMLFLENILKPKVLPPSPILWDMASALKSTKNRVFLQNPKIF